MRRTLLRKTSVAALLVVAAQLVASCRLGKKEELEHRPLPEPLPASDARGRAKAPSASPRAAPPARTAPSQPRNAPSQPALAQPGSTSQAQQSPPAPATAAEAGTEKAAEAGAPAPTPSMSPAQLSKCLEQCNALLGACVKRLTQSDAGTPSAETVASCTKAESDCRAACL